MSGRLLARSPSSGWASRRRRDGDVRHGISAPHLIRLSLQRTDDRIEAAPRHPRVVGAARHPVRAEPSRRAPCGEFHPTAPSRTHGRLQSLVSTRGAAHVIRGDPRHSEAAESWPWERAYLVMPDQSG
ncbi:hypothetical protein GCM10027162_07720 [Streptomyces incanus]